MNGVRVCRAVSNSAIAIVCYMLYNYSYNE